MTIYNDSPQLRAEYKKISEEYEETVFDQRYKQILKEIANDPNKKETIISMDRIQVAENEEYIIYSHTWEGTNAIGSYRHITQSNVGLYPVFQPIKERYLTEENTYADRTISKNTINGYFIPFTKDKADELHKLCNEKVARFDLKPKYYVYPEGGTKIVVNSYQDWRDGDFQDLHEHGKITLQVEEPNTIKSKK